MHDHICPPQHWHGLSGRHSSSSEEVNEFSPCLAYFETRYIIAVNSPTKEVMERFPSKHGNYRYVCSKKQYRLLINYITKTRNTIMVLTVWEIWTQLVQLLHILTSDCMLVHAFSWLKTGKILEIIKVCFSSCNERL